MGFLMGQTVLNILVFIEDLKVMGLKRLKN